MNRPVATIVSSDGMPSTAAPDHPAFGGPSVLSLRDVTVEVLGRTVLTSVSLNARAGELLLLAGRNGAGKTTLLHAALDLLRPTSGQAYRAHPHPPKDPQRHENGRPDSRLSIGVSFDTPAMLPRSTAREVIDLMAEYRGLPRAEPASDPALRLLVGDILDVRCNRMSHGMRQRVSLAAALHGDPDLVVLDEPYNGLDPSSMAVLSRLLRRAADRGAAVVVSSHYLAELAPVADHHVVLEAGRVVLDSDLLAPDARRRHTLVVGDRGGAVTVLRQRGVEVDTADGRLDVWVSDRNELATALRHLVAAGVDLYAVTPGRPATEELVSRLLTPDLDEVTS